MSIRDVIERARQAQEDYDRRIPVQLTTEGDRRRATPTCDICGEPATVRRPATRSRDLAFYCDADAARYLGWGDTYHRIEEETKT